MSASHKEGEKKNKYIYIYEIGKDQVGQASTCLVCPPASWPGLSVLQLYPHSSEQNAVQRDNKTLFSPALHSNATETELK